MQPPMCETCKGKTGGVNNGHNPMLGVSVLYGCRYSGIHETLFVRGFDPSEA